VASISNVTTAQIPALPQEHLEALADALLDFQGPADLAPHPRSVRLVVRSSIMRHLPLPA
jgi:hypothetical protein